jgi:hypothetical protein
MAVAAVGGLHVVEILRKLGVGDAYIARSLILAGGALLGAAELRKRMNAFLCDIEAIEKEITVQGWPDGSS